MACKVGTDGLKRDDQIAVLDLVIRLNEELNGQDYVEMFFGMRMAEDGASIDLVGEGIGTCIWNSVEDERDYASADQDPGDDTREDLEVFVRRQALTVLKDAAEQLKHVKL